MTTMAERTCSDTDNEQSAKDCKAQRHGKLYAPVYARIESAAGELVVFKAKDKHGNFQSYAVKWRSDDVWTRCPSTLPSVDGQLPAVGAEGTLYVEKQFLDDKLIGGTPKWPDALPAPEQLRRLRVWPTKIVVTGIELATDDHEEGTVDLLDPTLAGAEQTISLRSDNPITLSLTQEGFNAFLVNFPTVDDLARAVEVIKAGKVPATAAEAAELATAWGHVAAWLPQLPSLPRNTDARTRAADLLGRVLAVAPE
jgi:hypothetical protein